MILEDAKIIDRLEAADGSHRRPRAGWLFEATEDCSTPLIGSAVATSISGRDGEEQRSSAGLAACAIAPARPARSARQAS